jgi:hypothetical protein
LLNWVIPTRIRSLDGLTSPATPDSLQAGKQNQSTSAAWLASAWRLLSPTFARKIHVYLSDCCELTGAVRRLA